MVIPMVYHSHRHPDYWTDPEAFDPDRFAPEAAKDIHRFVYYPFGGGARMCLGTHLAPFVLQTALVMVMQRYQLTLKPRFHGDPQAKFGFEIHPKDKIMMAVKPHN